MSIKYVVVCDGCGKEHISTKDLTHPYEWFALGHCTFCSLDCHVAYAVDRQQRELEYRKGDVEHRKYELEKALTRVGASTER